MAQEIDRTVELSINGMTCGHCVASVTEELSEVPGVLNVEVILNSGATSKATVVTNTELDDNALRDAVSEAGFEREAPARVLPPPPGGAQTGPPGYPMNHTRQNRSE